MNEESEHFRVVTMKVLTMQLNSIIIMDLLAYGGAAVGIVLATREFMTGSLSLSACLFMILLSADFFLPMRRLGSYFHVAMNGMAASDRIFTFLSLEEPPERTAVFPERGGNFLLKSVSFSYDGEREVLRRYRRRERKRQIHDRVAPYRPQYSGERFDPDRRRASLRVLGREHYEGDHIYRDQFLFLQGIGQGQPSYGRPFRDR